MIICPEVTKVRGPLGHHCSPTYDALYSTIRSWISRRWSERTTAVPDSPGCTDEGNVDQSVMLEGRLVSFTGFSFVSGSCYCRRTITRDQSLKTGQSFIEVVHWT